MLVDGLSLPMASPHFKFVDRADAGRQLAARLVTMALDRPIVYALPRGGVPVAAGNRARPACPARPHAGAQDRCAGRARNWRSAPSSKANTPQTVINEEVRRIFGAEDLYLERARQRELAELERRRSRYLGDRPRIDPTGCTAIVVDDGLATGATAKAALIALKRQGAAKIVLAIPAAPEEALADIRKHTDLVVCVHPARRFNGVGAFYNDFHQLTDEETIGLLRQAWAEGREASPGLSRGVCQASDRGAATRSGRRSVRAAGTARHYSVRPWQRVEPPQSAQHRRRRYAEHTGLRHASAGPADGR